MLSLVLIPVKGYSWWLIPGAYYAQLNATAEPSGAGTVYVYGDSDDNIGSNVKHTDTGYGNVTFDVKATVNGGYLFQGWSSSQSGTPLLSTNLEYKTGNYQTNGTSASSSATNASQYYIFAIYSVIPYTLTLLPGSHGQGSQVEVQYDAQSTDNLQNHLFPADPGYQFKDWKVTVAAGYWTPVGNTYNNKNIPLSTKYGSATLTEEWSATNYDITYNANGGRVNYNPTLTERYNIESSSTVRTATRSGHTFSGWKVTSVETEGNWVLNQIVPSGTSLAGKYGKVTLTAQWDLSFADITINVSGLDSNESAIFTVSNGGGVLYTVALSGSNPSVIIKDLPTDVQYTVQATNGWSWAYGTPSPTSHNFNLGTAGYTASFTYPKNTSAQKHAEQSNTNWKE